MTANTIVEDVNISEHKHQQQQQSAKMDSSDFTPTLGSNNGESFCIRWKGFHGNILHCLEDMKTEEDFADVTLACDVAGVTVHAHKLVLASCSNYFRRILKDCCQLQQQHPVIILNEVQPDILEALMTYMYMGQVFLSEDKLPTFFKTAAGLEIKGIANVDNGGSGEMSHPMPKSPYHHPIGDLSLLAAAATISTTPEATANTGGTSSSSITKRRKAMPRRLDIVGSSNNKVSSPVDNDENSSPVSDNYAINLSTKGPQHHCPPNGPTAYMARAGLLTIPNPTVNYSVLKEQEQQLMRATKQQQQQLLLPSSPVALDMSMEHDKYEDEHNNPMTPASSASSSFGGGGKGDGDHSPEILHQLAPVSSSTTPEQMAALLGPSWKSRQPRLCQYCQRMFSNKFNLKQHILNMHTVGRELHCDICQKKVKNKWYLRRHHVTHHGAPLKK